MPAVEPLPPQSCKQAYRFDVGTQNVKLLLDVQQVKGQLALLRAFSNLKTEILGLDWDIPHVSKDPKLRWGWFVGLAVERFSVWMEGPFVEEQRRGMKHWLPPIDVLMVWHAYMLNPKWFGDDALRLPQVDALRKMGDWMGENLYKAGLLCTAEPTQERLAIWDLKTNGLPWEYHIAMLEMRTRSILCPGCGNTLHVDLMKENGWGYLQTNFMTQCDRLGSCPFATDIIDRGVLALYKFAQDVGKQKLAGVHFQPFSPHVQSTCQTMIEEIANSVLPRDLRSEPKGPHADLVVAGIMKKTMSSIRTQVGEFPASLVQRVFSAYIDDRPFSVELVGAVLRQGTFVEKMVALHWTRPGFFDEKLDEMALHHAIARYHAFLDILSTSPRSFFVPTLDIDLVWHTHQLMPSKYALDTVGLVGRFVDHDDKVEGLRLSSAFDATCAAWKKRFKLQYTYCGCPMPGETIGQRLSSFVSFGAPVHYLIPPNRLDILSATHPSEHNAVRWAAHTGRSGEYGHAARIRRQQAKEMAEPGSKVFLGPHSPYSKMHTQTVSGISATGDNVHDRAVPSVDGEENGELTEPEFESYTGPTNDLINFVHGLSTPDDTQNQIIGPVDYPFLLPIPTTETTPSATDDTAVNYDLSGLANCCPSDGQLCDSTSGCSTCGGLGGGGGYAACLIGGCGGACGGGGGDGGGGGCGGGGGD